MTKLFLFEAGSTKTTLLICTTTANLQNRAEIQEIILPGYNPNRKSENFTEQLAHIKIQKKDRVYFYGSGLASNERKLELKSIFRGKFQVEMDVFDDILGAARALFQNQKGVFAIMGTGGVVAYYDGESVTDRRGGYGYLIDDLGGGYELGKRVVSAWLNGDLPDLMGDQIALLFQSNRQSFTHVYYSQPDLSDSPLGLQKVAATVKFIPDYLETDVVNNLVANYFKDFLNRHLIRLCAEKEVNEFKISGSIAEFFSEAISDAAISIGLRVTEKLRFPAQRLLEYHQNSAGMKK